MQVGILSAEEAAVGRVREGSTGVTGPSTSSHSLEAALHRHRHGHRHGYGHRAALNTPIAIVTVVVGLIVVVVVVAVAVSVILMRISNRALLMRALAATTACCILD